MSILSKIFGSEPAKFDSAGAERLSRLLMAEIKLFESYKLERGLKANDIRGSLFIEIEQARTKFRESYPQIEAEKIFDSALVEILADGDRSRLGSSLA